MKTVNLDNSKLPLSMQTFYKREQVAKLIYDFVHANQVTHRRNYDDIASEQKKRYQDVAQSIVDLFKETLADPLNCERCGAPSPSSIGYLSGWCADCESETCSQT